MGIAVLKGTGDFAVGIVTINHQGARQGLVPKDLTRDTGGTALAKQKQTDFVCGEEPNITALAIVSPTRLVRMFDRRLSVLLHQTIRNRTEDLCQTMEGFDQRPQAHVDLLNDSPHGNAMEIVQGSGGCNQLVSIEALWQNPRRRGLISLPTTRTVSLRQKVENPLRPQGRNIDYTMLFDSFIF
jgi:hypothetical protein